MNCPLCRKKMKKIRYQDQNIEACPYCRGMWFDQGELQMVLEQLVSAGKAAEPEISTGTEPVSPSFFCESDPQRICPRCGHTLATVKSVYDPSVFLDKCGSCHGFWADKDEIRQISLYLKDKNSMKNLSYALALAQSIIWQSKPQEKMLALAIAVLYLVLVGNSGGIMAASSVLAFLALPLICIFFGDNVHDTAGMAGAKFIGPFITQSASARSIINTGWILLLLPSVIVLLSLLIIKIF